LVRVHRFLLAIAVSLALILSAPFISLIRSEIRARFPGHFVLIIGAIVALGIGAAIATALLRIRERRAVRYGALAAALVLGTAYANAIATSDAQANAVERFHFVEYGLVTFLFYRAWRPLGDAAVFVLPALAGILVGTGEEWFQWFLPGRIGEMRDVFLNGAAILCGLLFSFAIDPPDRLSFALSRRSAARVGLFAAAVTIAFAAFVHTVHLGHTVADPEIGTFRSRYDAVALTALAADRAVTWKMAPPRYVRVSREDQFLSEGILHVQERNRRWEARDHDAAWRENRILEKYYGPVLDTTYPATTGATHRWSSEQRADAEQRAASAKVAGYASVADGGFIRTWPKPLLWTCALAIAAAMLAITGIRPSAG
jgi:hypothetical protein